MHRPLMIMAAAVLLATACAGPAPQAQPGEVSGEPEDVKEAYRKTAEECQPGKEHWRTAGVPRRGGTFVRSGGGPPNLDLPRGSVNQPGPLVYEGLVVTRGCYYGDGTMAPLLAESWQVGTDGVTFTLKLRDGVRWHNIPPVNGRAFTSADVASSIEYHLEPRHASQARAFWQGVTHQEPDSRTVVLKLSEPNADYLEILGHFQNIIVPREVVEQEGGLARTAIGTGPYMFDQSSWKPGIEHSLNRNTVYYERGADGGPLPYLDRVHNLNFEDYVAEVAAFRSGQLDRTGSFGLFRAEADEYRRVRPDAPRREELQGSAYYLWFNLEKQPWNDVRVRRAVSMAIDRDDLIARHQGAAVYGGFVSASQADYSWSEAKRREMFKVNREEARRLLAEAGYPPGSINTTIMTGSQYQQDAEVVQQQLAAVGINAEVTIEGRTWGPIWTGRKYPDLGWGGAPGAHIMNDLVKSIVETGNPRNVVRFSDAEVDRLTRLQAGEYDTARRKQIVDQLQERLTEAMPFVPGITGIYYHFYNCRVQNIPWTKPAAGQTGMKLYWLDQAAC